MNQRYQRLYLPAARFLPDSEPLFTPSTFAYHFPGEAARPAMVTWMPPTVPPPPFYDPAGFGCTVEVNGLIFEPVLIGDRPEAVLVLRTLSAQAETPKGTKPLALACLLFDHQARSGNPEALAVLGLARALLPRWLAEERARKDAQRAADKVRASMIVSRADDLFDRAFGLVDRLMEEP